MIPSRLLPQTVTYTPLLGEGAYGPIYGNPVTVPARVTFERRLVRTAAGSEVVSSATIYLQPGATPTVGDSVAMPDGTSRDVIAVATHVGARAPVLVEVDVG